MGLVIWECRVGVSWMIASVCCPRRSTRWTRELVGVLAEYDAVGGWQGRGWRSFAHYLSVRTNFAPRDAGTAGVDRSAGR